MHILLVADMLASRNFQPLSLEYLSSSLRASGHTVRLADASVPTAVARTVASFQPGFIGFSATTGLHRALLAINRALKKDFRFFSVFGGPHATMHPQMLNDPDVDAICLGEGEEAIVELAGRLAAGRNPSGVRNIWFKTAGGIGRNPLRPLVRDLERLPRPDWGLVDEFPYCREFPVKVFITARGCPFACAFCQLTAYRKLYPNESFFRRRRPADVVAEIEEFRRARLLSFVFLFDDTFGVDPDWLADFCEQYGARIRVPYCVQLRADLVTDDALRRLAKSGLAQACFGLESGIERLRFQLLRKRISDVQILEAARIIKRHGVKLMTYSMLGLPGTSLSDDVATLKLNWQVKADFSDATMFQPYPKIPLADEAVRLGVYSGDPDAIPRSLKRAGPILLSDKDQRVRLMYLFPILAAHPASDRVIQALLALPLAPLYRIVLRTYEGLVRVFRVYRVSISIRVLLKIYWRYVRF
jgi:radical SAM superfamily enzyme YgiQ (UPF0313 family)